MKINLHSAMVSCIVGLLLFIYAHIMGAPVVGQILAFFGGVLYTYPCSDGELVSDKTKKSPKRSKRVRRRRMQ